MTVASNIMDNTVAVIVGLTPGNVKQSSKFIHHRRKGGLESHPKTTKFDRKFTLILGDFEDGVFFGDPNKRDWTSEMIVEIGYIQIRDDDEYAHRQRMRDDVQQICEALAKGSNYVAGQDLLRLSGSPEIEKDEDGDHWIARITWEIRYQEAY